MDKEMSEDVKIEVEKAVSEEKPKRRGGRRPGAGRPSLVRENIKRAEEGLPPILPNKRITKKKKKSDAILPQSKKARSQEVLAEMLGRKGKYIVQKVLDKALDDDDEDQMACLKIVMDRVLPSDYISKMKGKNNQISIQIMGVGETKISSEEEEVIDGEYTEENE
jgi:hypothetical protein